MTNHLFSALFPESRDTSATCLIDRNGGRMSYAEVLAFSARYAAALASLGVAPGDRVAAQIEKSVEALFLYLGCVRAGAVFLPLNPAYTPPEVDYFLNDARPRLFVQGPDRASEPQAAKASPGIRIESLGASAGTVPALAARQDAAWNDVKRGPDDLAAILYTSGTTGRAKGAMLTHGNLRSNAEALVVAWRFSANDVLLHALPIFHVHGLFVATNVTLVAGASMLFLEKFDARDVLARMPQTTVLMGVPTFYTRLLDLPELNREAVSRMRLFVSGSAPLRSETHAAFRERTGHVILERYGMTETSMNTSNPYDGERVAGSVGLPLPGVEIRIADQETGRSLPAGEIGMIEIRGPNVFAGYWGMPEKTAEEFRDDGFFASGDLGRIDERGYLWIVGRGKDVVISGGFNVYPKEVELELDALSGVAESAVIGVPHPDFGEAVTAVVVADGTPPDEVEIVEALRRRLAPYKLPKRVVFVDELPRNAMAKVQKAVLRETWRDLFMRRA